MACVVCPDANGLTEGELDKFCKDHDQLPNFKRPREHVLTEEKLPRTDTGTVRRETVQTEFFTEAE